jgi:hypothetical protein
LAELEEVTAKLKQMSGDYSFKPFPLDKEAFQQVRYRRRISDEESRS